MENDKQLALQSEESKQVQTGEANTGLQMQKLFELAAENPAGCEIIERLTKLQNEQEDRLCKREFDYHFAEMQKEFKPIKRSKSGDKGKYAPVDELVKKYGPTIAKHGFSFTWDEEPLEEKGIKIIIIISGYGYSKTNSKILPEYVPDKANGTGKPIMNSLQAEGTRSTYGYRYTFKAGFGITETDEDTDGEYIDSKKYEGYFKRMDAVAAEPDTLLAVCKTITDELEKKKDEVGVQIIRTYYVKLRSKK
jgi:hypothetical protein